MTINEVPKFPANRRQVDQLGSLMFVFISLLILSYTLAAASQEWVIALVMLVASFMLRLFLTRFWSWQQGRYVVHPTSVEFVKPNGDIVRVSLLGSPSLHLRGPMGMMFDGSVAKLADSPAGGYVLAELTDGVNRICISPVYARRTWLTVRELVKSLP